MSREEIINRYTDAQKKTPVHLYDTPFGDLVTPGPMTRMGWAGLARWIIEEHLRDDPRT